MHLFSLPFYTKTSFQSTASWCAKSVWGALSLSDSRVSCEDKHTGLPALAHRQTPTEMVLRDREVPKQRLCTTSRRRATLSATGLCPLEKGSPWRCQCHLLGCDESVPHRGGFQSHHVSTANRGCLLFRPSSCPRNARAGLSSTTGNSAVPPDIRVSAGLSRLWAACLLSV